MSYPDVMKAGDLRPGDRIYNGRGERRRVLATFWKVGYSNIRFLVEGQNHAAELPIGQTMYVLRVSA